MGSYCNNFNDFNRHFIYLLSYKMIPFVDFVVGSNRLSEIENFNGYNFSITNKIQSVEIEFYTSISPALYSYFDGTDRFYCFNEELLAEHYRTHMNKDISPCWKWNFWETHKWDKVNNKEHRESLAWHKYEEFEFFTLFKSIELTPITYSLKEFRDLFSVPIDEAKDIVINWISRYKSIINNIFLDGYTLCPDLSAGIDTRTITYFWRYYANKIKVHTKFDKIEYPIVTQLADRLGINELVENLPDKSIGISGKGAVSGMPQYRFILDGYYKHYLPIAKWDQLLFKLCPFLDMELLKIKLDSPYQLKNSLNILLANDLIDIPIISHDLLPYYFDDNDFKEAERLGNLWGLRCN